jgi:phosphoglycerol transferase MdoB-like AlkP superfamily enzyme
MTLLQKISLNYPVGKQINSPVYLVWIFAVSLFFMFVTRWIFYFLNLSAFSNLGMAELFKLMFIGIRFDLSALALLNLPVVFLIAVPLTFKYKGFYQNTLTIIVMLVNSLAILLNLIDTIYFRYISKRTTFELFQFLGNKNENIDGLIFQFLSDFWYMLVILLILIVLLFKFITFFSIHKIVSPQKIKWYLQQTVFLILGLALSVVLFRGGFQLKPISLITAANYTSSQNVPLLINSPFSIIKTLNNKSIPDLHYYSNDSIEKMYSPIHNSLRVNQFVSDTCCKNANIVILILESFGRDYIGYYNKSQTSCTPFLDSLLGQSLTFEGFSNGRRSIEGLPSILSGLPSLMDIDFPSSPYVNNKLVGLGTLLLRKGYHTSFFHGGNNGTMSFDAFAKSAGFLNYYGRNEYNNEQDFDGKWGIFDKPFLQFAARKFDSFNQPFVSAVFTLSSHHPYTIPLADRDLMNASETPAETSLRYTDRALKDFFAASVKMDWYQNTIFVITADHTPESARSVFFRSSLGIFAVPVAFFIPNSNFKKASGKIAQHIDILPSCMALVGAENDTVFSYGRNVFDSVNVPFTVNYINGVYQYYDGRYVLKHDGNHSLGFYDLTKDSLILINVSESYQNELKWSQNRLQGIIQQYNNRMNSNKLYIE